MNTKNIEIYIPQNARPKLYLNIFSFLAGAAQRTTIKCETLNYSNTFTAPFHDNGDLPGLNTRYGHDIIDVQSHIGKSLIFTVTCDHKDHKGAKFTPSSICPLLSRQFNGYSNWTILVEDGSDNDNNDTVILFDNFSANA